MPRVRHYVNSAVERAARNRSRWLNRRAALRNLRSYRTAMVVVERLVCSAEWWAPGAAVPRIAAPNWVSAGRPVVRDTKSSLYAPRWCSVEPWERCHDLSDRCNRFSPDGPYWMACRVNVKFTPIPAKPCLDRYYWAHLIPSIWCFHALHWDRIIRNMGINRCFQHPSEALTHDWKLSEDGGIMG